MNYTFKVNHEIFNHNATYLQFLVLEICKIAFRMDYYKLYLSDYDHV